ncbi:BAR-domain-containing protein [Pseudovirgaria hyperparasitica]|uniref:BAR-domain-containing protein n=1 Tax=Pseudovirgaria hyperparasitica TaxID=470096 RepID=A0A6A6W8S6_9PEZI|nr:BAR-domain-containing protein [Pseudovirgaria hyperparasitica]KAF2759063.1 BAR-domain-containing protein [Pseudovirgaria hyperparasitica]
MSWKGFTKGITRAPQTVKSRFNIGEISKDPIYIDAERRFQELEQETKKLHDESKKYFDSINGMLSHQIEFSRAIAEIYKPISGRMSDPDSFVAEGNPEGIRACEEYEVIVKELQATLAPELEMIESRIVKPAEELLEIVKVIRKSAVKRDHKQLDYDRHRATLKKLQDKKEKTLKDEKALYKAENDVELATQDYEYFNNVLKEELPQLFRLEREFIRPLFQSFYYMQLNIFYTLHEKMQDIDIGYFNLTLAIEDSFEEKRGDTQAQAEAISIVKFKTTGQRKLNQSRYGQSKYALENKREPKLLTQGSGRSSLSDGKESAPPPYSPPSSTTSPPVSGANWGTVAKSKPPPPKPKPSRLSGAPTAAETVTALYDYEAQAHGDLSFSTGEVIEIVQRTQNENEWWTGKIGTRQGQFPGNYVQLNS